jgi:hypothetical protein
MRVPSITPLISNHCRKVKDYFALDSIDFDHSIRTTILAQTVQLVAPQGWLGFLVYSLLPFCLNSSQPTEESAITQLARLGTQGKSLVHIIPPRYQLRVLRLTVCDILATLPRALRSHR